MSPNEGVPKVVFALPCWVIRVHWLCMWHNTMLSSWETAIKYDHLPLLEVVELGPKIFQNPCKAHQHNPCYLGGPQNRENSKWIHGLFYIRDGQQVPLLRRCNFTFTSTTHNSQCSRGFRRAAMVLQQDEVWCSKKLGNQRKNKAQGRQRA